MAKLISGKEVSAQIRQKIKEEAQALRENSRSFAIPFDRQQGKQRHPAGTGGHSGGKRPGIPDLRAQQAESLRGSGLSRI